MTQQLIFTSAPAGLRPGTRGFTTVAATRGMIPPVISRLESLSGYPFAFEPSGNQAHLNPTCFSCLRLAVASQRLCILSRIAPAGVDYTGRSNALAHHLILSPQDRVAAGPAAVLMTDGLFARQFDGPPRELPALSALPAKNHPPRPCQHWQRLTGDAGWGGMLPSHYAGDPRQTVYVIYPPGLDVLPLFAESMALMPAQQRWAVTFSTYYHSSSGDVTCLWRGVLAGTAAAANAIKDRQAAVIDLTRPLPPLVDSPFTLAARRGEVCSPMQRTAAPVPASTPKSHQADTGSESPQTGAPPALRTADDTELMPAFVPAIPSSDGGLRTLSRGVGSGGGERRSRWRGFLLVVTVALVLSCVLLAFGGILVKRQTQQRLDAMASLLEAHEFTAAGRLIDERYLPILARLGGRYPPAGALLDGREQALGVIARWTQRIQEQQIELEQAASSQVLREIRQQLEMLHDQVGKDSQAGLLSQQIERLQQRALDAYNMAEQCEWMQVTIDDGQYFAARQQAEQWLKRFEDHPLNLQWHEQVLSIRSQADQVISEWDSQLRDARTYLGDTPVQAVAMLTPLIQQVQRDFTDEARAFFQRLESTLAEAQRKVQADQNAMVPEEPATDSTPTPIDDHKPEPTSEPDDSSASQQPGRDEAKEPLKDVIEKIESSNQLSVWALDQDSVFADGTDDQRGQRPGFAVEVNAVTCRHRWAAPGCQHMGVWSRLDGTV